MNYVCIMYPYYVLFNKVFHQLINQFPLHDMGRPDRITAHHV